MSSVANVLNGAQTLAQEMCANQTLTQSQQINYRQRYQVLVQQTGDPEFMAQMGANAAAAAEIFNLLQGMEDALTPPPASAPARQAPPARSCGSRVVNILGKIAVGAAVITAAYIAYKVIYPMVSQYLFPQGSPRPRFPSRNSTFCDTSPARIPFRSTVSKRLAEQAATKAAAEAAARAATKAATRMAARAAAQTARAPAVIVPRLPQDSFQTFCPAPRQPGVSVPRLPRDSSFTLAANAAQAARAPGASGRAL